MTLLQQDLEDLAGLEDPAGLEYLEHLEHPEHLERLEDLEDLQDLEDLEGRQDLVVQEGPEGLLFYPLSYTLLINSKGLEV